MEKLRNKVAHNNLFINSDLERGQMLFNELMNIIDTATKEVDNVILQQEEKEAIAYVRGFPMFFPTTGPVFFIH